jgi:hypothetical protein
LDLVRRESGRQCQRPWGIEDSNAKLQHWTGNDSRESRLGDLSVATSNSSSMALWRVDMNSHMETCKVTLRQ